MHADVQFEYKRLLMNDLATFFISLLHTKYNNGKTWITVLIKNKLRNMCTYTLLKYSYDNV